MNHHQRRIFETKQKLFAAMERMRLKQTVIIPVGASWNQVNLAREAGIDQTTLGRKDADGTRPYADVLKLLAKGPGGGDLKSGSETKRLRHELAEKDALILQQARRIAELTRALAEKKDIVPQNPVAPVKPKGPGRWFTTKRNLE